MKTRINFIMPIIGQLEEGFHSLPCCPEDTRLEDSINAKYPGWKIDWDTFTLLDENKKDCGTDVEHANYYMCNIYVTHRMEDINE